MNRNEKAFLDMIAWSEIGQDVLAASDNGYNVLVGSLPGRVRMFDSYVDHPRILVEIHSHAPDGSPTRILSTAAGRYQILKRIFDHYRPFLHLPDFSPASQDAIALELIRERHAIPAIAAGRIVEAIYLCRGAWASIPGAGYDQPEHRLDFLIAAYTAAGGTIF